MATPGMTSGPQEERIDPPEPRTPGLLSLAATPIATISPIPTSHAMARKPSHALSSDLLFLSGQRLIRWDHLTHFGVALAEYVIEFSPNAVGDQIALLRNRGGTAHGAKLYDLDLLNLETMQIAHLLEDASNIGNIALSPDGKWLAYSQPLEEENVLAFPIAHPEQITEFGSCLEHKNLSCSVLNWSPDSKSLLWTDQRGIWMVDLSGDGDTRFGADQINPGIVPILDPAGKPSEIEAWLSSPLWSPKGRFVLVEVSPKQSNVRWQAVLDVSTRRIIQVMDTYQILETDASLSWLEDGTLAVARASNPDQNQQPIGVSEPAIQLWQVVPTHTSLLIPGKPFRIKSEMLLNQMSEVLSEKELSPGSNPVFYFEWLQPMEPGKLMLSARILNSDRQPVLFRFDLRNGSLTPFAKLIWDMQDILWAPDHSGFLAIGTDEAMSYFSIEDGKWFDLADYGDTDPNSARWLPPALR